MTNVIRLEELDGNNLTWKLPDGLSGKIDSVSPAFKQKILRDLTETTQKYVHFMTGALQSGRYGEDAFKMFNNQLDQVANNMIRILQDAKERGEM